MRSGSGRTLGVLTALAVLLLVLAFEIGRLLAHPTLVPPLDFAGFWSAARLAIGGNPYDPDQLMPLQRSIGWVGGTLNMVWNPPWALPLILPFGLLPYEPAQYLWLLVNAAIVFVCTRYLWHYFDGPQSRWILPWVLVATFAPVAVLLKLGQMTAWVLLGLVGFLHFERQRRDWPAGMLVVLVAVKPHVVYLFWPALLLWAWQGRRWSVLAGAVLATGLACAATLLLNPNIFACYAQMLLRLSPLDLMTPSIATVLRVFLAPDQAWPQFVPLVFGLVWLGRAWLRRGRTWDWQLELPVLALVSILTSPYSWVYDQILLIIPLLQVSAVLARMQRGRMGLAFYGLIDGLALALLAALSGTSWYWFSWLAPAWTGVYALLRRSLRRHA